MDEVTALTHELASVPSHGDERAAGDRIEDRLRAETGAAVTRDAAGNVIARKGDGDRTLALVGHRDVVPSDESQVDGGYAVAERDGRIYDRGAGAGVTAASAGRCDRPPGGTLKPGIDYPRPPLDS